MRLFSLFLSALLFSAPAMAQPRELFQYSVLSSLMAGVYDGEETFAQLKQKGDFGIGTFSGLNGEMLAVEGKFYQIKADGKAYEVASTQTTPYATLTFFTPDATSELAPGMEFSALSSLETDFPSRNVFYALRIDGTFSKLRTRSIAAQEKPYQPLAQVAKTQSVFDFTDVEGTMVGFWFPAYSGSIGVPGFHFHFLTKDKKAGGHVLDFTIDHATLQRATLRGMALTLPNNPEFLKGDAATVKMIDINAVEK